MKLLEKVVESDLHPADMIGSKGQRSAIQIKEGIDTLLDSYDVEFVKQVFTDLGLDLEALEKEISRRRRMKEEEEARRKGTVAQTLQALPEPTKAEDSKMGRLLKWEAISRHTVTRLKANDMIRHQKISDTVRNLEEKGIQLNQQLNDQSTQAQQDMSDFKVKVMDAMSPTMKLLSFGFRNKNDANPDSSLGIQNKKMKDVYSYLNEKFKIQLKARDLSHKKVSAMKAKRERTTESHDRTKSLTVFSQEPPNQRFRIKIDKKPSFIGLRLTASQNSNKLSTTRASIHMPAKNSEDQQLISLRTTHFGASSDMSPFLKANRPVQEAAVSKLPKISAESRSTSFFRSTVNHRSNFLGGEAAKTLESSRVRNAERSGGFTDNFTQFRQTCIQEFTSAKTVSEEVKKEIKDENVQNAAIYRQIRQALAEPVRTITDKQLREFSRLRLKNHCHNKVADLLMNMMIDKKKALEMINADQKK